MEDAVEVYETILGEVLCGRCGAELECDDCESSGCAYNHGGECRFARVHERRPEITMEDGCTEGVCG